MCPDEGGSLDCQQHSRWTNMIVSSLFLSRERGRRWTREKPSAWTEPSKGLLSNGSRCKRSPSTPLRSPIPLCNWEHTRSCFPATCQAVEGPHDLVGRRGGPEERFDFTGEGKRNLIANRVAPPPVSSHKACARRERVGIIGHHPECILDHQDRHHAFPR